MGCYKGKVRRRQYLLEVGFRLLQMVQEPNTRECASENVGPLKGVDCEQIVSKPDTGQCTNEGVGPPKKVDCEI